MKTENLINTYNKRMHFLKKFIFLYFFKKLFFK